MGDSRGGGRMWGAVGEEAVCGGQSGRGTYVGGSRGGGYMCGAVGEGAVCGGQ